MLHPENMPDFPMWMLICTASIVSQLCVSSETSQKFAKTVRFERYTNKEHEKQTKTLNVNRNQEERLFSRQTCSIHMMLRSNHAFLYSPSANICRWTSSPSCQGPERNGTCLSYSKTSCSLCFFVPFLDFRDKPHGALQTAL